MANTTAKRRPPSNSTAISPAKRARTRSGCQNCRRKKRKCDEARPACGTCRRRGEACERGLKLSFRAENAQCLPQRHPSMRRTAKKRPRDFAILDTTSEVIRDYHQQSPISLSDDGEDDDDGTRSIYCMCNDQIFRRQSFFTDRRDARSRHANGSRGVQGSSRGCGYFGGFASSHDEGHSPTSQRQTEIAVANLLDLSQGALPARYNGSDGSSSLQAPQGVLPAEMIGPDYMHHLPAFTPDGGFEDGIFLPGSAYQELHSKLRSHLIQEGKSNAPTRPGTPSLESARGSSPAQVAVDDGTVACLSSDEQPGFDLPRLDREEECLLWRNWIDEIAPWLDKFDNDRHFQHTIPTMATSEHNYLRYAILALSARQLELKETTLPTDRSLALYQSAIHLLLPHLPTRSTAVIASCVILCVLEMMSCSPKAWKRHLDGCASLMEAVGINGFVGGVDQALFWCFARMDVCGGLISSVKTLIPVSHWASRMDIDLDAEMFCSSSDFAGWANYSVYLVAQVLDLLTPHPASALGGPARADPRFCSGWTKLWRCISDWRDRRPAPMHAIMTIPSCDTSPFPTILFSNPAAISGNQLHHTAAILMLQNQPPGTRLEPKPRSILWHARQVCGISISNGHHGAWTNGVQPLWIAGRCMSHPAEHRAILDLLDKIERESGWGTRWRADDLKEFWGDLGD